MQIHSISDSRKAADGMTIDPHSTTTRETVRRWLSPVYFGLAALAFLLPFATVSCDDASTTFTGIQLVAHTVPAGGAVDRAPDCSADISVCVEARGSTTATIALVAALIGLALGLLGFGFGSGWCAAVGLGAMAVLPFKSADADMSLHLGYTLALVLFVAACGLHLTRAVRVVRSAPALSTLPPEVIGAPADDAAAGETPPRSPARPLL